MEKHHLDALALAVAKSEAERIITLVQDYYKRVHRDLGGDSHYTRNLSLIELAAKRIKAEVERTNKADNPDE
jgi:hypothetical protein